MINEEYIHLVTAYLEDSLTAGERAELNELVERGEIDILDIKEMESLYQNAGKISVPEPSEQLRDNFYNMLDKEKSLQHPPFTQKMTHAVYNLYSIIEWRRLAGAAAIFIAGMLIGNWAMPFRNYHQQLDDLSNEVTQMRQVVALNLLDNTSPTQRLKAVNISMDLQSANQRIINALLQTLDNDPNVNVRLAAVEALVSHGAEPQVRQGLVRSINKQQSPLVQAALADAMLALQEKKSVKELKELLRQDNLDRSVRKKLQNTIAALS